MSIQQQLEKAFTDLEAVTVSSSFGGISTNGKAPRFHFKPIVAWLCCNINSCDEPLRSNLYTLQAHLPPNVFKYTLDCLSRFAFCIELTNLGITSTKMKTRWVPGNITKTRLDSYANYEGIFQPGDDERSATFDECYQIFCKCIELLVLSNEHQDIMKILTVNRHRSTSYEAVFTYIETDIQLIHQPINIRLVQLQNISWLVRARPIMRESLGSMLMKKISVKTYKTDRSQTGEVQTNRAKRWECLSDDFQHASIEDCWSVEMKLLTDVANFQGYPAAYKQALLRGNLTLNDEVTVCPITFKPMIFADLLTPGGHGESKFQVGHLQPLKNGGNHRGDNIEWISSDGNRIQGSLSIEETRHMLVGIFNRMHERGLIQ